MRRSIPLIGSLVLSFSLAAQTPSELLVQRDLEKTRTMTAAESFSYARRTYTMYAMEVLAKMLEAWRLAHGRYPDTKSIDGLRDALSEMFDATKIPTTDRWSSQFRYMVTPDRKQYRIVSAGGDLTFDEASWTKRGDLSTDDEDAVLAGGNFVRQWTDATKPGLGVRAKLTAPARALLAKADSQLAAEDRAGALASYIDAVKADARGADLEAIRRYSPLSLVVVPSPPPPPPPPGSEASTVQPPPPPAQTTPSAGNSLHISALRQYLDLHPGDLEATRELLVLLPGTEALTLADAFVATRSTDPEAYELRALARIGAGQTIDALADFEKAASLDSSNAEKRYELGVAAYEAATRTPALPRARARELLQRSMAALERAESLQPNYPEALMYRSIVLRKMSELETDAAARQKLSTEAEGTRVRAMKMMKSRDEKKP